MAEYAFFWFKKNPLFLFPTGVFAVLLLVFVAVMLSSIAEQFVGEKLGLCEKNEILKFVGIGMGGVLLALQVMMSHRRAKAMEGTAKAQAKATEEQATANKNTEKGRRQERLKNAIEHLGHDSDSVRLGGAYELFHLAQEAEVLRQTVLDILCAHIRRTTSEDRYRQVHAWRPSEEVQSLLTLLFIQQHDVFEGLHFKLQRSWLNGSELPRARLGSGDLTGVHLKRADLGDACLQGACLNGARLHGASLYRVCLQEADLRNAHLYRATLEAAKLQCANCSGARLRGTDLSWAKLHGAIFFDMAEGGAHFQGGILRNTELHEADLRAAQMQGVTCKMDPGETFAQRMRRSIGRASDFNFAIFSGGLRSDQDVNSRVRDLASESAETLRKALKEHIGKPRRREPPDDSGVVAGSYSEQEANEWIAEYAEAMSDVPNTDDGH